MLRRVRESRCQRRYRIQPAIGVHHESNDSSDYRYPVSDLRSTEDTAPVQKEAKSSVVQRILSFGQSSTAPRPKSPLPGLEAWRWSLAKKGKLEANLRRFIKWSDKLKPLAPLLLANNAYYRTSEAQERLRDTDTDIDVFGPHMTMRHLIESPSESLSNIETSSQLLLADMSRTVVEYKYFGDGSGRNDSSQLENQARQLSQLLQTSGHSNLHTLPFKGFTKDGDKSRYIFAFEYPSAAISGRHCTLYDLIRNRSKVMKTKLSLRSRFEIATTLAQALGAFHADGWVHKSFRSQAIRFFFDSDGACLVDSPYLAEFELSRPESAFSLLSYDNEPEKNLYRHPERQGPPSDKFTRVHDVYALGVVLLEIGLWETADSLCDPSKYEPLQYQRRLLSQVEQRLEHHMGPHYTSAVLNCLSGGLKQYDATNFSIEFQDQIAKNLDARMLTE